MKKETTTIRISKQASNAALEEARKEGMKLYAWIERTIQEKIDEPGHRRITENKAKIKYLCHHCDMLETP